MRRPMPWRRTGWSSTRKTFLRVSGAFASGAFAGLSSLAGFLDIEVGLWESTIDSCSAGGEAEDGKWGADQGGAVAHRLESHSFFFGQYFRKTDAVVTNRHGDCTAGVEQDNLDMLC